MTDYPLTCGHCRRAAATHVFIAYYTVPALAGRRISELVCRDCGGFGMRTSAPVCHTVQMFPVTFSMPEQPPAGSLAGAV